MLKLYKRVGNSILYWEAWDSEGRVLIHWGTAGDRGDTREVTVQPGDEPATVIRREATIPLSKGYQAIPTEKLIRLVVQYKIKGMGTVKDLDKRNVVEELMNECLGWSGLGHCDGGDIGSGTMNVFCFVVDGRLALTTVVAELKKNQLLGAAVIATTLDKGEKVVWPENFEGEFCV
jgi:hypothetical protein